MGFPKGKGFLLGAGGLFSHMGFVFFQKTGQMMPFYHTLASEDASLDPFHQITNTLTL